MRLFSVFIFSFIGLLSSLKPLQSFVVRGKSVVTDWTYKLPSSSTISEPWHNPKLTLVSDTGFLPKTNFKFPSGGKLSHNKITAVPTFQNISLYWKPVEGASNREVLVRYRIKETANWAQAQSLWFDDRIPDSIGNNTARSKEYRGSIVNLRSGTVYEIEVFLMGVKQIARTTISTMNENFPIAKTVMLPASSGSTLVITEGGTDSGYVLYTGPAGATIDVSNSQMYTVDIRAPFVIVKGLNIRGAQSKGIRIAPGISDVVIDGNDISEWGRLAPDTGALHDEMGIGSDNVDFSKIKRIIIQNNRIHDPRYGSNSWTQWRTFLKGTYHPIGANAIGFNADDGQIIIRHNQIYASKGRYFMDCIGGSENFAFNSGFPGPDSDIYDNTIRNCWDDAIESEGMNQNVRVFNNFIDVALVAHGISATSIGPLYVYRNITNRLQKSAELPQNSGNWVKSQGMLAFGGRVYIYHNTMLTIQEWGISDVGRILSNTVSRNNILRSPKKAVLDRKGDPQTSCDYDLIDGGITTVNQNHEKHAILAVPQFDTTVSMYSRGLLPGSPGHDGAIRIPNFNDGFKGKAPDMGAVEN